MRAYRGLGEGSGEKKFNFFWFENIKSAALQQITLKITNTRAFLARTLCLLHPLKRWICPKLQDLGHFFGRYHQAHTF
jgi:hypothetical protein